jgi:hypothetical protein
MSHAWLSPHTTNNVILGDCSDSVARTDRSVSHRGGGICVLTNNTSTKAVAISIPLLFAHVELCVIDIIFSLLNLRSVFLFVIGLLVLMLTRPRFDILLICVIV